MNDKYSTTAKAEKLSNEKRLEKQWKNIDWKKAENEVNRLQIRIAKAVKENKWNKVKRLQYLIVHSYYAKILAVKTVATNKGRKTAGIDKVIWQTNSEKMNAAISLTDRKYKSKPLRRIYIDKKGKKTKRPLSIPCMYDRAMQALYSHKQIKCRLNIRDDLFGTIHYSTNFIVFFNFSDFHLESLLSFRRLIS